MTARIAIVGAREHPDLGRSAMSGCAHSWVKINTKLESFCSKCGAEYVYPRMEDIAEQLVRELRRMFR